MRLVPARTDSGIDREGQATHESQSEAGQVKTTREGWPDSQAGTHESSEDAALLTK